MKKILKIFFAILLISAVLSGCGQKESVYEKEVNEINLPRVFFRFEEDGEKMNHVTGWLDDAKNVQFVSLDKSDEIDDVKKKLNDFLHETYGIDISEKINQIETQFFISDSAVLGYQDVESNVVCINQNVFEDDRFKSVWIHEALHMLGFKDDCSNMSTRALYDVLDESVTIQAMLWMNEKVQTTSYTYTAKAGTQIILVDPELVVNILTQKDYDILAHINNVLKDVEYPVTAIPEETTIAEQYGAYLMNIIDGTDVYINEYGLLIDYVAQEITTAYCREFELSDQMKVELERYWLFEEYDQIVLKSDEDCYYFVKK